MRGGEQTQKYALSVGTDCTLPRICIRSDVLSAGPRAGRRRLCLLRNRSSIAYEFHEIGLGQARRMHFVPHAEEPAEAHDEWAPSTFRLEMRATGVPKYKIVGSIVLCISQE